MKLLLTGHSGFLGLNIKEFLIKDGFNIKSLGRSSDSDIICDLSCNVIEIGEIDFVIHAAGKAHIVPKTQEEKDDFFKVNVEGTQNLLQSIKNSNVKTLVFISTVAVYGRDAGELIDEDHPLQGETPYAVSKIKAEELVREFGEKHNCKVIILRLPLITGKNPVGNLKGMANAIKRGYYFRIGKGDAQRSIIAATDIAKALPELFMIEGTYNFTDCTHPKISDIDEVLAKKYNKSIKKLPFSLLKFIGKIGDVITFFPFNSNKFEKLTKTLTFSNDKILSKINFRPVNGLNDIM